MNFSRRANWHAPLNRLAIERENLRRSGQRLLDLTETNPTRAAIEYPLDELSAVMARAARAPYEPDPAGLRTAREALAAELSCHPDDLVLTASTSEAYSWLFKLLTDPGEAILTATPTYPLLEHLAALEQIELHYFAMERHRRWEIDISSVRRGLTAQTRAIAVVHPNNPTGSYLSASEQDEVAALGLPLISDEVFYEYPLAPPPDRAPPVADRDDTLCFTLGGLSKSAGLPHYKLGWIRLGGPAADRVRARQALELIADNFLSVSTPVQQALPELLRIAPRIRSAIAERTRTNLELLVGAMKRAPAGEVFPVEGGWAAVIRLPRTQSDEELARSLLQKGAVVQPGYFFDFAIDSCIVISLLPPPDVFAEGIGIIAGLASAKES